MHCPHCNTNNSRVLDTTTSHKVYFTGRSKDYLYKWGLSIANTIWPSISNDIEISNTLRSIDKDKGIPFVARSIQCKTCGRKYRTIELITKD